MEFMKMRFYDFVAKTLATHTSLQLAAEMKSNFRRGWLLCWYFLICFNLQTPIKSATRLRANRATLQVFMSPPIAAQSYWQTGTLIPVLRPVADYMDVQYNPENLDVLITKQAGMANSPRMNVKNGKTVEKADKLDKQKTWDDFRSSGLYILGLPMHSQCGDKCVSALTLGKELHSKNELLFFSIQCWCRKPNSPKRSKNGMKIHSTHGSRESFTKFVEVWNCSGRRDFNLALPVHVTFGHHLESLVHFSCRSCLTLRCTDFGPMPQMVRWCWKDSVFGIIGWVVSLKRLKVIDFCLVSSKGRDTSWHLEDSFIVGWFVHFFVLWHNLCYKSFTYIYVRVVLANSQVAIPKIWWGVLRAL